MLRILFFMSVCLLISIPQTSIQDVSTPIEDYHISITDDIESFIQWLTEQQYQYEIAYYALALNNIFPNFAKYFHERSEQKYNDIKGLIRLCQILNLDIDLQFISSNTVNRPLRLLSPERINQTNFAQFFLELKSNECETTIVKLTNICQKKVNTTVPLEMYFKKKLYTKQMLTCKLTSDIYVQIDRFIQTNSNDNSIPFSLMFFDSLAKIFCQNKI